MGCCSKHGLYNFSLLLFIQGLHSQTGKNISWEKTSFCLVYRSLNVMGVSGGDTEYHRVSCDVTPWKVSWHLFHIDDNPMKVKMVFPIEVTVLVCFSRVGKLKGEKQWGNYAKYCGTWKINKMASELFLFLFLFSQYNNFSMIPNSHNR